MVLSPFTEGIVVGPVTTTEDLGGRIVQVDIVNDDDPLGEEDGRARRVGIPF